MTPEELQAMLDEQSGPALPQPGSMGAAMSQDALDDAHAESFPLPPAPSSPKDLLARVQQLKANPTKNAPPVGDVLSRLLGQSQQDMSQAMDQRNQLQLFANLGQAGESLGKAFTPLAKHEDTSGFWKTLQQQAQQPVSDVTTQQETAKNALANKMLMSKTETQANQSDPNSTVSDVLRQLIRKEAPGIKVTDDMSYAEMAALEPSLARLSMRQAASADKAESAKAKASDKQAVEAGQLAQKMTKALDSDTASSRSALGKAALKKQSAEALEALTSAYKDPNQLDVRQIQEIARSLDSLLAGGAATVSGSEHLVPKSAAGTWAKTMEWLSSDPHGANQGKFVERMMETVRREKLLAQKQMLDYAKQKLPAFNRLKDIDPATHQELLASHGLDEESLKALKEEAKTPEAPKDEHSEAMEWAQAHPTDPRAIKIMQLQGAK